MADKCVTFLFFALLTALAESALTTQIRPNLGESCSAGPDYDVKNLTTGQWTFNQTKQGCIGGDNCTITLGLCQNLNIGSCSDASACMSVNVTGQKTIQYKLGSYKINPFNSTTKSDPGTTLVVRLDHGGNYTRKNKSICTLSVEMKFICDRNNYWKPNTGGTPTVVPKNALQSAKFDESSCLYSVTFNYEGICTKIGPPMVPNLETMSAGSVLIIIFFASLSAYCVFGSAINCCRGYKGKEILPQSEFWVMLPVYIADGFVFTFTCGGRGEDSTYDSI